MILEQKFYNVSIALYKTDESKMTHDDIEQVINIAREKILGPKYDDIEITEDLDENCIYMDIGYNNDPYYVEENLQYYPGCPETGPTYSCAGEPAEPAEVDGVYENDSELWWDFFHALPKDIDGEIVDSEYDSPEDVCERAEETDEPDPDDLYDAWRDSQLFDD